MKKLNTRSVLFILLVTASICSYIFLNTVSIERLDPTVDNKKTEEAKENEEIEVQQKEIILPDVRLLKKALDTGRRLIPAS